MTSVSVGVEKDKFSSKMYNASPTTTTYNRFLVIEPIYW